jgi:hypothetical protein
MEIQVIRNKIYEIRGVKVMLDRDLAALYRVTTAALNQAVKRNKKRFPDDFMFQLSKDEWESLISQFVISNRGGVRKMPYAFTEQGVAMLSGLLNSDVAIDVNIGIMRAFVVIRRLASENSEIRARLELIERTNENILGIVNDLSEETREDIDNIYEALGELSVKVLDPPKRPRNPIGYNIPRD